MFALIGSIVFLFKIFSGIFSSVVKERVLHNSVVNLLSNFLLMKLAMTQLPMISQKLAANNECYIVKIFVF